MVVKVQRFMPGNFAETGFGDEFYLGCTSNFYPNPQLEKLPIEGKITISVKVGKGKRKLIKGAIDSRPHSSSHDGYLYYEYLFIPTTPNQRLKAEKILKKNGGAIL